ncbi:MAG: dihydrofolate reductase [Oscillospiraceae bacterium]|jgi:dihydrofolate reductase
MIKLIVSVTDDWGIGLGGKLLYRIPEDLKRFRSITLGNTVIMGRRTLESLPGGRPLEGRRNIVVTAREGYKAPGAEIARSPEEAMALLSPDEKAFCIGGELLFRSIMPYCEAALITRIYARPKADCFIRELASWRTTNFSEEHEFEGLRFRYITLVP